MGKEHKAQQPTNVRVCRTDSEQREILLSRIHLPKHCKLVEDHGKAALKFKKIIIPFDHLLTPTMNVVQLLVLLKQPQFIMAKDIEIPEWFANAPGSLLPCTSAPDWPLMFAACLLHDWLYWIGGIKHGKSKAFADVLLYEIIRHNAKYYWNDRKRGLLSRQWGYMWAFLFLKAVRIIGPMTRSFRYRPASLSAADPDLQELFLVSLGTRR